jgi:YVTN family beta-propeller protein
MDDQPSVRRQPINKRWLVAVLALIVVVVAVLVGRSLLTRSQALPAASSSLPLRTVADLPLPGTTSRFDYQSLNPKTDQLFIAHLGASTVVVFDTGTRQVVGTIPHVASVHGVLVVPEMGTVYATATGKNQVAVIDASTLHVTATLPGGTYPDGLAYDPVDHQLFISDERGGTETVIDTQTNQVVGTIPLGGEAGNTQYDPISHQIFVDVQTRNELVAIDPATRQIVGRYPLAGCDHDHSLLIDAPQRLAFIACEGNAKLLVMDLGTMQVTTVETVGDTPDVLALDSSLHRLYVAAESGVVSIFDEAGRTLHKLGEGQLAPHAHSVAVDSRTHCAYFPLENSGAKPVLRIMQPPLPTASHAACS